jgi:site-specific DNA-methyltransferase (adenine-specific)
VLELNKIHLGDSYELLHEIEEKTVDLIIMDPPYAVGMTSNGAKGNLSDMNLVKPFYDGVFRRLSKLLKSDGGIYVNCDWRTYPLYYEVMQRYFDVRNCIVWDYEWIKAGVFYRFSHEFVIFATSRDGSAKRDFSASERDVWRIKPINFTDTKNKLHQSQKPEPLVEKMILDFSNENDLVLDPFAGSGTTCAVAKRLNRRYIGIEIDANNHEIATNRLNGITKQGQTSIFTDFESEVAVGT